MANQVEAAYESKEMAAINLNGERVGFYKAEWGYKKDGFTPRMWWYIRLANIHNQSNPIEFAAASLTALVNKIKKHEYQLVRYRM